MKKLWAILLGLALAVVVVIVGDIISHKIYPLPKNIDFKDIDQVAAYMKTVPAGALVAVIIGQVLALLLGGALVIKLTKEVKPVHIFSLIFILLSIMNLYMIPHPNWFSISSIIALGAAYFVLLKLGPKHYSA